MAAKSQPKPTKQNLSGLFFNINTITRNMNEWFKTQGIEKRPNYNNTPVAITSALEYMTKEIIDNALLYTKIDRSDMKRVPRGVIICSLSANKELMEYFERYLRIFDKSRMYCNHIPIPKKEIKQYLESIDNKILLSEKANNLLYFLMDCFYSDLLYVGKLSMDDKTKTFKSTHITTAIKIILRYSPILASRMTEYINKTVTKLGKDTIDDEVDGEVEVEGGENGIVEGVVEEPTKTTSPKDKSTRSAKKSIKQTVDDELIDANEDDVPKSTKKAVKTPADNDDLPKSTKKAAKPPADNDDLPKSTKKAAKKSIKQSSDDELIDANEDLPKSTKKTAKQPTDELLIDEDDDLPIPATKTPTKKPKDKDFLIDADETPKKAPTKSRPKKN